MGTVALPVALAVGVGATAATAATAAGRTAHVMAYSRSGTTTSAADAPPGAVTLTSTGAEQSYTVPSGVVLLSVDAIGAGGGGTSPGSGYGLTAQLPVTPNQTLYAEVGVPGTNGGLTGFGGGGAAGKTSAGPTTSDAGSDVRTCSEEATSCAGGESSAASRLIVAGGGGGGGGQGSSVSDVCGFSQSGGNAGTGNGSGGTVVTTTAGTVILGSPDATEAPSTPAGGGSSTAPGVGGPSAANCGTGGTSDTSSAAGSPGVGAAGGAAGTGVSDTGGGGGGGGGYFGGGGGASGPEGCISGACDTFFSGEGGGGGSSFVTSAAQLEPGSFGNSSSAPSVTFTPQIEIDSPADGASYREGQVVNASWECNTAVSGCTGTTASGQPVGTTSCGANTYSVTGTIMGQTVIGTADYTVTLNVTTSSLDGATTGTAYRDQLEAACGVSPYKWKITSGTLPKGLKLRSSGMIAGVPYKKDKLGPYTFAVVVKDSANPHDIATGVLTLDLASQ
jgi:hypothetical protein